MLAGFSKFRWRLSAMTSALFVVFAAAFFVLATLAQAFPEIAAIVLFFAAPPFLLMAIVFLGRLALDYGDSEKPKGELERLIEKKQHGDLRPEVSATYGRGSPIVAVMILSPKKPRVRAAALDEVLDRLVDWKRAHGLRPVQADEPASNSSDEYTATRVD